MREQIEKAAQYLVSDSRTGGAVTPSDLSALQQHLEQSMSEQRVLRQPLRLTVKVPQERSQHTDEQRLVTGAQTMGLLKKNSERMLAH